jgi:hypothetical protein
MRIRWIRLGAAILIGAAVFAGANAVDTGLTRPWPDWARASWATALLAGTIAGVFLLATGLGFLTDEALSQTGDPSSPHRHRVTVSVFITVYVATLIVALALAIGLEALYGVSAYRTIVIFSGGMFLLASTGRPWWLYETIRRLRWFALIERDAVMRVILFLVGLFCGLAGLLGKL